MKNNGVYSLDLIQKEEHRRSFVLIIKINYIIMFDKLQQLVNSLEKNEGLSYKETVAYRKILQEIKLESQKLRQEIKFKPTPKSV